MNVPLVNLTRQYEEIRQELETEAMGVLLGGNYIMGSHVRSFEKEFAAYVGTKYAVSVGNGTDALVIALEALGIGPGDEVITTPYTFFATAESISLVGAVPVFADVRLDTFNIDETKIEAAIGPKTKAIMPVHIFGQCCDMDAINAIAKKHNLLVIEDACQAAGATFGGVRCGKLSDIACFSFFPTKNLSCAGDGGIIMTNSEDLALICDAFRRHGSGEVGQRAYQLLYKESAEAPALRDSVDATVYDPTKYYNYLIGHNSRLDELQAAILRLKLPRLDAYVEKRRKAAAYYNQALADSALVLPYEDPKGKHAYHLYIVQSEDRDKDVERLAKLGIATGVYYPVPLHKQMAYQKAPFKGTDMPNADYLAKRTFAIPMFPEITEEEQAAVVAGLRS